MCRIFVVRLGCVVLALMAASLISLPPFTNFAGSSTLLGNLGVETNVMVSNRALKGDKLPTK